MRESILRRCAAVGCDLDEDRLPQARKITNGSISDFLFGADYASAREALQSHGGEHRFLTLLMLETTHALTAAARRAAARR